MKVQHLIALLQSMPQDAHVVVSSEGISKREAVGITRNNIPETSKMILNGFSADELLKEEIDVLVLQENIVAIALVVNSIGDPL